MIFDACLRIFQSGKHIMGIPLYFHTITKTYGGVIHTSKPRSCDWYFFDYNGAIHHAAQSVLASRESPVEEAEQEAFEKEIHHAVWDYTQTCVSVASPKHNIGIFIDGVAPIAKINQQRKRRYLSYQRHRLLGTRPIWDTNAISPGTAFMLRLHAFLRARIREDDHQSKYQLSGADEPGEGEHKIFAQIASLPSHDSVFIHGLDADLIMLSLMSHHRNIVLMREPTWPFQAEATSEGFLYLDVDAFRQGLLDHLHTEYKWPVSSDALADAYCEDAKAIIETYVVLCFLLGNDFLPHAPTLSLKKNGYEEILRAAKDTFDIFPMGAVVSAVASPNRVFVPFIADVITRLAKHEDGKIMKINEDYLRKKPSMKADTADAYPLLEETKDKLASMIHQSSQPKRWRSLYYKHLFFVRMDDTSVIANACDSFVQGVCWTYAYYKRLPKPFDWYYPYGYPPSLLDLSNHLQGSSPQAWEDLQTQWSEEHRTPKFLDPAVQLLCILPLESQHLIPYKYRSWMTDHNHGIAFMFPKTYAIQTYLHTHLWECVPVLPPLDIPWILSCFEKRA